MSFQDLSQIKIEYRTLNDEVIENFYIPVLEQAKSYKRAVGFFSSNILLQLTKGLGKFVDNNGKMQLIVSPRLEEKDYEAIRKGYEARDYIENQIVQNFDFDVDFDQKEDRFAMLSYMISHNLLDIKIVLLEENNDNAMYHEKMGVFEDAFGNSIAFSGSANETYNGYNSNYETLDVFCSWKSEESDLRCNSKKLFFNRIWDGRERGLITIPFPDAIKAKILEYKPIPNHDFVQIDINYKEKLRQLKVKNIGPKVDINKLYDYQSGAINNWANNNYRGIFDMATGTGKTYTGIGAISRLFEDKKRLVTFICCPYTHLVDQWCEELQSFNITPIKCYGSTNYMDTLKREVIKFKNKRTDFVCAVICNVSFKKDEIQELVKINLKDTLLLVDEAHNFGALGFSKCLTLDYPYRLALSATLERAGDIEGTQALYDFFGNKCIEYKLERAIIEGKLTPYYYYPVEVYLTDDERDEYITLTKRIGSLMTDKNKNNDAIKSLLIKRARIIAGASNKIEVLLKNIDKYKTDNNMLIYCGAVRYGEEGYDNAVSEKRQIEIVLSELQQKGIVASKFTSEEDTKTRHNIFTAFKEQNIQALVAIKCLDEGMNIPAIKTAFIMASSTNPKEYIQRRGRVLRKYPGKDFAEIYDFITLPYNPVNIPSLSSEQKKIVSSLVVKELKRMIDFSSLSQNTAYSNNLKDFIMSSYEIDLVKDGDDIYA